MFGHISGTIFEILPSKTIVKCGGIGFVINITIQASQNLKIGSEANFWTHTAVRENSIDLYGFENEQELKIFELLLSVSGVGPKSGLAILGVAGVQAIEQAVATGDTSALTTISGIGKKTAEKIVIELNGKLVSRGSQKDGTTTDIDVFEALKSLGYRERDIQETIKQLPKEIEGTNERIKYALKQISN